MEIDNLHILGGVRSVYLSPRSRSDVTFFGGLYAVYMVQPSLCFNIENDIVSGLVASTVCGEMIPNSKLGRLPACGRAIAHG